MESRPVLSDRLNSLFRLMVRDWTIYSIEPTVLNENTIISIILHLLLLSFITNSLFRFNGSSLDFEQEIHSVSKNPLLTRIRVVFPWRNTPHFSQISISIIEMLSITRVYEFEIWREGREREETYSHNLISFVVYSMSYMKEEHRSVFPEERN